ncbi:hypothetical protein M3Y97_00737300 [Aphelenchoides bicaudatus]|nr:hypothetical protein M3Y97_00737300 [Aphelenchoides bicaudatus]
MSGPNDFVKMLNPDSFYVDLENYAEESEFFNLICLTTGKLALRTWTYQSIPNVLKTHWKRLDELICFPGMFELIDEWAPEPKVFDKLTVYSIANEESKDLGFWLVLGRISWIRFSVVTCCGQWRCRQVAACTLNPFLLSELCVSLIQLKTPVKNWNTLRFTPPSLMTERRVGTFGDFLDIFVDDYGECVRLTESLKDAKFASKINFCPYDLAQFLIPDNWKDQLKVRLGVEEVAFEEIRDYLYGKVIRISLVSKHGQSEFKFRTKIKYRDEENDTLYD